MPMPMTMLMLMFADAIGPARPPAQACSSAGAARLLPPMAENRTMAGKRLFTATRSVRRADFSITLFHACRAYSESGVREGLVRRAGVGDAYAADIREGVDLRSAISRRLVGLEMLERLDAIGDVCPYRRPLECGGVIHIVEYCSIEAGEGDATSPVSAWARSG